METKNINQHDYWKRCLEAKGQYCHLCESEENIAVHHIDGDRENNELGNLLPVCRGCYIKIQFRSDYQ